MTDRTGVTFEAYVTLKRGDLTNALKMLDEIRRSLDFLTMGTWEDRPDGLTPAEHFAIDRAAFVAMNADWDLSSAARALTGARDRLTRALYPHDGGNHTPGTRPEGA